MYNLFSYNNVELKDVNYLSFTSAVFHHTYYPYQYGIQKQH